MGRSWGAAWPYRAMNISNISECVRFKPPRPAMRNLRATEGMRSKTVTTAPPALSTSAAIRPAGPAPITAMVGRVVRMAPVSWRSERGASALSFSGPLAYCSAMLRLTEIKLPLDHGPDALKNAVLKRLRVPARDLKDYTVFKRGADARKRSAIVYVYIVDADVENE